jgi:serine phosphatase RsbU (regulator of sigma subunit)
MAPDALARLEADLRSVQEANRSFLSVPSTPEWDVGLYYRPARILSGDFYDWDAMPGGREVSLTIGDVAGKGLPAGLLRATLQAVVRTLSHERLPVGRILERAHRHFKDLAATTRMASLFHGVLSEDGGLQYASAGHLPPLLRRDSGAWESLEATGPVLGVLDDPSWREERTEIQPGDLLLLYTDGITDAEDAFGKVFEAERLVALVDAWVQAPAPIIARQLASELERFAPGEPGDDRTLVLARRLSVSGRR